MLQILGHSLPYYIIVSLILYLHLFYRYLSSLGYVDESKLAIYGSVSIFKILEILLSDSLSPFFVQSYGGYMAGNVGSSGSGVFRAAISQSPVSDWHYYGEL